MILQYPTFKLFNLKQYFGYLSIGTRLNITLSYILNVILLLRIINVILIITSTLSLIRLFVQISTHFDLDASKFLKILVHTNALKSIV